MTRDQKIVAAGAATGVASMALAMWLLPGVLPAPADVASLDGRLAYALRWCAFAALPLFFLVVAIGNARALGAAIDPTLGREDKAMLINGRVADNSLEQFTLFFAGARALAAGLPPGSMRVIGAAAIVFAAARILFWIGYRIDPLYRAFGFAATFYLNLGLLLAAFWFAIR